MIPAHIAYAAAEVPGGKYQHACLTVDEGLLSLQATDGHVLVEITWEDSAYADIITRLGFDAETLALLAQGEDVAAEEDFEFPALDHIRTIWSKTKKLHAAPFGICAQKLTKMLKILMDLGVTEDMPVRMWMDGPHATLHLDALDILGGISVRAAIAPMRL